MAITVKHLKVSTVPDAGDDTLVEPSDWNADHTLTGTVPVANGGTGAATLTGYVKGNGTANMTAAATIPNTDITGLGTASTKDAGAANGVATLDAGGKVPVSELPAAVLGALSYQGTWDASTNTPTLTSSVGTKGYYYVVNVAGNTNLNGITDWLVGDWAVYNGSIWQKVDNTETVTSVNGQTGAVVLTTTDVAEGTNLYYTDVRARAAISAGTGISYDNTTGVVTNAAPDQTVALTDGTAIDVTGTYPNFTINNTAPDQVVSLTGAGTTTVSGTYPNFTITSADSKVGDVVGPASATDNAVARYDTTTGKLIQNSLVIIDDTGSVTGVNALTAQSLTVNNNATLGSSNTDSLDVRARISSDLDPETNNAKDIGTNGRNWRDAFFGRTVHTVNLELTGTTSFDGSQGTAGQVLTSAGTGATPTWTTPTTGTVTSVTGTAPVVSSGGNTPAISMAAATGSVNGYLTSTDWNTFNNKTSNTGTVTSVGGTGTVNGLTLTGTVTTTGNLTLGGTLDLSSPPAIGGTTPAAGSFSSLTDSGNLNFTGTSNRITGDFSNATISNRAAFQTSTANSATRINAFPSGTGTVSEFGLFNNSNPTNAGYAAIRMRSGDMQITSEISGTGTYLPLTMFTGGSEKLRIDTSGNVGIGTSSPTYKLHVAGTTSVGGILVEDSDASNYSPAITVIGKRSDNNGAQSFTGRLALAKNRTDAAVGAGNSLGTIYFGGNHTNGTLANIAYSASIMGTATGAFNSASDMPTGLAFYTGSTGVALDSLSAAGAERMRIDSSGFVLIGTTTTNLFNQTSGTGFCFRAGASFDVLSASDNCVILNRAGSDGGIQEFRKSGTVVGSVSVTGSATAYNTSSDYRLKENITPMTGALDKVAQLKPVTYTWKADGSDGQGFIAHELQAVVPECVTGEKDAVDFEGKPVYQSIDTSFLIATLTAAIQELKTELDSVKSELQTLKGS
jgi:hypothetical protein